MSQANAADKEKFAVLEKQLADTQSKLQNPETALAESKEKLTQAYKAFDDLKREVLPEQIKTAQEALTKGDTAAAENVFKQILSSGKENAAKAAYQLGQLSYDRIDYRAASVYEAGRGKSSTGWFYGFKLHLIANDRGEILSFCITPGNMDDRKPVPKLVKSLVGQLFGDRGYISKKLAQLLASQNIQLMTTLKKNIKAPDNWSI